MRRSARIRLSIFAALAAAAAALALACNPISSGSRIGAITGQVYGVDGLPSASAVVYLTSDASGGGAGGVADDPNTVSQQAPVSNGGNGGLTIVSSGGDFQITAAAGEYDLVAADSSPSAAYVFQVRVAGGSVLNVGAIHLQACTTTSSSNPCPSPYGGAQPTPQPPSTIQIFAPDQTNVEHVYYASGAEQVDVHAVGPITGADGSPQTGTLDAIFHDPANAMWAGGASFDLATSGSNLLVQLQVSDSYDAPSLYRAVGGSLSLIDWQPAPGGTVAISLSSVELQSVDPTSNTTPGAPIEIVSTPPISGVVSAVTQQ